MCPSPVTVLYRKHATVQYVTTRHCCFCIPHQFRRSFLHYPTMKVSSPGSRLHINVSTTWSLDPGYLFFSSASLSLHSSLSQFPTTFHGSSFLLRLRFQLRQALSYLSLSCIVCHPGTHSQGTPDQWSPKRRNCGDHISVPRETYIGASRACTTIMGMWWE